MRRLWKIPGGILASAYVAWVLCLSVSEIGGGESGRDVASGLVILPFLGWLSAAAHLLREFGRPWSRFGLGPLLFTTWSSYVIVVVPFLLEPGAAIAGSPDIGLLVNATFAVSIIVGYDHVASALPRAEAAEGGRRAGYFLTLLQLLFPPCALWLVHSRIVRLSSDEGTVGV